LLWEGTARFERMKAKFSEYREIDKPVMARRRRKASFARCTY
jgi:hypothetical protein